ncbi:MAG: hypothetical protein ACI9I0_000344 [Rhodoferax sp.]|jgi:hypothetical protein
MNSGNRPEAMGKFHINQKLAGLHLLAGYLISPSDEQQKSGA